MRDQKTSELASDVAAHSLQRLVRRCRCCGKEYSTGGYAHPSKCWHCAPAAVPRQKMLRSLRERMMKAPNDPDQRPGESPKTL